MLWLRSDGAGLGLLHALGSTLRHLDVEVRSAHVATHAGRAVDVLYVVDGAAARRGGAGGAGPLSPSRCAQVVAGLQDAAEPRPDPAAEPADRRERGRRLP